MRYKFLLICRKNTLGFVELIRGKYNLTNLKYLKRLVDQLTIEEKTLIQERTFLELWNILWYSKDSTHEINCVRSNKQRKEYNIAKNKFYTIRNGYILHNNKVIDIDTICNHGNTSESESKRETMSDNINEIKYKYNMFGEEDEEYVSFKKLIDISPTKWKTPEWGFPKGRRNMKETNLECSKREFMEETGLEESEFNVFYNNNTLIL